VLSLVGTINLAVFGAGLYFLSADLDRDRQAQLDEQERFTRRLVFNLSHSFNDEGGLRVARILEWPFWDMVADAVIVDRNPSGISLNPVGLLARGPHFDRERIEAALRRAVESESAVNSEGGVALPIIDRSGRAWGGCWYRVESGEGARPIWLGLLPWFLASTLLLFYGTFGVLRRYVLRPVGALARGASRIRAGSFSEPIAAPPHSDELTDLIATFNGMARDVRVFHDYLESEADEAKEKAYQLEVAALRQRRLAAMGELAAGIAHEINNPLGGMLNAVDVLDREDIDADKRRRYRELLRGGLRRIQDTVGKLLRFTPRQAELEPLDLAEPARDALDLIAHRAQEEGVRIGLETPVPQALVLGQRSELGQAVLNLLVNALDALEGRAGGGRIEVRLGAEGEHFHLSVLDNGPGIEEGELERVADLFYTTKSVGRGTGLGLALVHNVIAQHGGVVQMHNRPGGGLRVDLVLPALATGDPARGERG